MKAATISIFRHLFASIAEEMGVSLNRTAYSPNIKERLDFSCAVFLGDGRLLAQAAHIPVHLGSQPLGVRAAIEAGSAAKVIIVRDGPTSEPFAPAEDWTGPMDNIEKDDLNPVGTEMQRADWDAPYQEADEKRRAGPRTSDETQEEAEDDWGEG